MEYTFIAKTLAGLEPVLEKELLQLGAQEVTTIQRGCSFRGDTALLYKANYLLRTAIRVLMSIDHFGAYDERELYDAIRLVP
jgi:putative N6-adenine-specific DNA methylase